MGQITIRDNALWAKHVEGDPELVRRILTLPPSARLTLLVDRRRIRFRKMRDGVDGRPTPGLRPEVVDKPVWDELQARRGESVSIALAGRASTVDPYLAHLDAFLEEWKSPEDAEAFDGL